MHGTVRCLYMVPVDVKKQNIHRIVLSQRKCLTTSKQVDLWPGVHSKYDKSKIANRIEIEIIFEPPVTSANLANDPWKFEERWS